VNQTYEYGRSSYTTIHYIIQEYDDKIVGWVTEKILGMTNDLTEDEAIQEYTDFCDQHKGIQEYTDFCDQHKGNFRLIRHLRYDCTEDFGLRSKG
jgi:hypothetical protein